MICLIRIDFLTNFQKHLIFIKRLNILTPTWTLFMMELLKIFHAGVIRHGNYIKEVQLSENELKFKKTSPFSQNRFTVIVFFNGCTAQLTTIIVSKDFTAIGSKKLLMLFISEKNKLKSVKCEVEIIFNYYT